MPVRRRSIAAISFDVWDTLVVDGSDEPKRRARGLRPKREERRQLVWQALRRRRDVTLNEVSIAYDSVDAACDKAWHDQHVNWKVVERLQLVLKGLGRQLPEPELAELVRAHEQMELDIPPDLIPG